MGKIFAKFDFKAFWEPSAYARKEYIDAPLTKAMVADVERELGYKLPKSYVEFMQFQNGGIPRRQFHRTAEPTTWAEDHIAIEGIYSIGRKKPCSLCGEVGSQFWIKSEWGYPPIGVYFADCPSAGHDMLCLDYRKCGPTGEPQVVHIDQELDYKIVFVAKNFESFIRGLEDYSAIEADSEEEDSDEDAASEQQVKSGKAKPQRAEPAKTKAKSRGSSSAKVEAWEALRFDGKSFFLCKSISFYERNDMKSMIQAEGGKVVTKITETLDYLIVGNPPFPERQASEKQGKTLNQKHGASIKILDETGFGCLFIWDRETSLAVLRSGTKGIERWNATAGALRYHAKIDLSGADFRGCDLSRAFLTTANLDRCDFRGAKIDRVWFNKVLGANFENASGFFLIEEARECSFKNGNFYKKKDKFGASLRLFDSNLDGANFAFSRSFKVIRCSARKSDFSHAKMEGADLNNSDFTGAKFVEASHCRLNGHKCKFCNVDFAKAKLNNADFSHADLSGANFAQCELPGAKLQKANLKNASFRRATLVDANFSGANLDGADFTGANVEGAKFDKKLLGKPKGLAIRP